jgi:hypothetical protein
METEERTQKPFSSIEVQLIEIDLSAQFHNMKNLLSVLKATCGFGGFIPQSTWKRTGRERERKWAHCTKDSECNVMMLTLKAMGHRRDSRPQWSGVLPVLEYWPYTIAFATLSTFYGPCALSQPDSKEKIISDVNLRLSTQVPDACHRIDKAVGTCSIRPRFTKNKRLTSPPACPKLNDWLYISICKYE